MEIVTPLISINWTLGMVVITFAVLCIILKKVLFEKVHNFMQAREQKIKDQFDDAAAAEKLAEEHLLEYNDKLDGIEFERRGVIKNSRELAEKQAQLIIDEANEKAQEIIRQAEMEIDRERALFASTMRNQVAILAIEAAEKIIESKLDEKEHMHIVDGIIKQEGEQWNH
jgi:F-type H+-transporting ATPase subunit b